MSAVRQCPICRVALSQQNVGAITVDSCPKCAGVFFDVGELGRAVKTGALETLEAMIVPAEAVADNGRFRLCPACDRAMEAYRYAYNSPIVLDSCPECGGIWADEGELAAISEVRAMHQTPSKAEASSAALAAGAQLDAMTSASRARAVAVSRAAGFLTAPGNGWYTTSRFWPF